MSPSSSRSAAPTYAVFSVCAGPELVSAAIAAAEQTPQTFFAGEFRDYVTIDKRPQFPHRLKEATTSLALVNFDLDPELALETTVRLQQIFLSRMMVVGVGVTLDAHLLLRAIRAGCTDFLAAPVSVADLSSVLQRMQQASILQQKGKASIGRVVAFFGAKGGVGTTTLAVHLANYLVTRHGKKVLLIDHMHQLGHVALYLGLKDTQYHFDELLRNVDRLDSELLNGFAIRHESGLHVMASPEIANAHFASQHDELERVMDFLRSEYDFVLIDSSMTYQETKSSIMAEADEVYIVFTPDIAALRDLARLVEHIGLNPAASGKLRLLLNRSTASDSLTPAEIQKAVRFPVAHSVPNNYGELLRSINQGMPISTLHPSVFNQALAGIARQMIDGAEPEREQEAAVAATSSIGARKRLAFWR